MSPGLVVMGRDSRSEGCGFESRHRIQYGHFFTYNCCKNCNICLKRQKIIEKEAGIGPFKKIAVTWLTFCDSDALLWPVPNAIDYNLTKPYNVHVSFNKIHCRFMGRTLLLYTTQITSWFKCRHFWILNNNVFISSPPYEGVSRRFESQSI